VSDEATSMIAFYAQIKAVHVAAVLVSGVLFLTRGLLVQCGRKALAMSASLRYASYGIDTVLLAAGLTLVAILPAALSANHWLAVKIALLVVYVVLGSLALKRAQSARARTAAFAAALLVYAMMFGIARTHDPMGWAAMLRG
jgi:uncharacterized membrane protein SirB2